MLPAFAICNSSISVGRVLPLAEAVWCSICSHPGSFICIVSVDGAVRSAVHMSDAKEEKSVEISWSVDLKLVSRVDEIHSMAFRRISACMSSSLLRPEMSWSISMPFNLSMMFLWLSNLFCVALLMRLVMVYHPQAPSGMLSFQCL